MAIKRTSLLVHILVCIFGIGSWIDINGVWVELPIMVQHLPEGWSLGSYLVIIIQLANIGPLTVTLFSVFCPSKLHEKTIVYGILVIGAIACLLLAFLWNSVAVVSGVKHSVALLVLQFFLALVDCTSSVVFLPFMSIFKAKYMASYFVGEGLSGLLPSIMALIQGAGAVECIKQRNGSFNISLANSGLNNETTAEIDSLIPLFLPPRFPVRDFFIFVMVMMVTCCTAFAILNHHSFCDSEKIAPTKDEGKCSKMRELKPIKLKSVSNPQESTNFAIANGDACSSLLDEDTTMDMNASAENPLGCAVPDIRLSRCVYLYYLLMTGWLNALTNAVMPSIQSFSCLPYGLGPYHLAVILTSLANPLACCIAFVIRTSSCAIITTLSVIGTALFAYIMTLALLSPEPFLVGEISGRAIMVSVWVLTTLCLAYAKVSIAMIFRVEGKKALLWCGAAQQVGSAAGAIIMFILVNVTRLFKSAPLCS